MFEFIFVKEIFQIYTKFKIEFKVLDSYISEIISKILWFFISLLLFFELTNFTNLTNFFLIIFIDTILSTKFLWFLMLTNFFLNFIFCIIKLKYLNNTQQNIYSFHWNPFSFKGINEKEFYSFQIFLKKSFFQHLHHFFKNSFF